MRGPAVRMMAACEVVMNVDGAMDKTTAALRGLSITGWVLLIAALLVLLVLLVLAFRWWRRRAARKPEAAPTLARPGAALGATLVADMRRFRRGLPASARRCLDFFHPVIVLGTESSGKAALVERFSGVAQRRAGLGAGAESVAGE